jgi:hypothetical protein
MASRSVAPGGFRVEPVRPRGPTITSRGLKTRASRSEAFCPAASPAAVWTTHIAIDTSVRLSALEKTTSPIVTELA